MCFLVSFDCSCNSARLKNGARNCAENFSQNVVLPLLGAPNTKIARGFDLFFPSIGLFYHTSGRNSKNNLGREVINPGEIVEKRTKANRKIVGAGSGREKNVKVAECEEGKAKKDEEELLGFFAVNIRIGKILEEDEGIDDTQ